MNEKDIKFEILNSRAAFIDPNRESLIQSMEEENNKLKDLEHLKEKLDEMDKGNKETDLHEAIHALEASYNHSSKARKNIRESTYHNGIWNYSLTGILGLVVSVIMTMSYIAKMILKSHRSIINNDIESLRNKKDEIERQIKEIDDGNTIKIYTKTSRFCEEFEKLSEESKRVILLILGLTEEERENQLLLKMNELITEAGRELTEIDLPQEVINYFLPANLESKLKFINYDQKKKDNE